MAEVLINGSGLGTSSSLPKVNYTVSNNDSSDTSISGIKSSPTKQNRSPRCEAFVMTGDKMLTLNPKLSSHYVKVIFYL